MTKAPLCSLSAALVVALSCAAGSYGDAHCENDPEKFNFGGMNSDGDLLQTVLSIPPPSLGPPIPPEKGYVVEKVSNNMYAVMDGIYITMFSVTTEGVVYFDAPPNTGAKLLAAVNEVTEQPVTHVVYSHTHIDHIGAAAAVFGTEGVSYVSSEAVAQRLSELNDPNRPVPDITFEGDSGEVTVGDFTFTMHTHSAHDAASIFIYVPEDKVMMAVDVVTPGWVPFRSFGQTRDIEVYVDTIETFLEFDVQVFVGGHETRVGDRGDIKVILEYTLDVKEAAAEGVAAVGPEVAVEALGELAANPYVFADYWFRARVEVCYDKIVDKYAERLAGVDVFGRSHCLVWHDFAAFEDSSSVM